MKGMQDNFKSVQYQFDQGYYQEICTVTKEVSSFIIFLSSNLWTNCSTDWKTINIKKKIQVLENYLVFIIKSN